MTLETLLPLPLQHCITQKIPLSGAVDVLRPLWGWKEQFTLSVPHPCSPFCHSEGVPLTKRLANEYENPIFAAQKSRIL